MPRRREPPALSGSIVLVLMFVMALAGLVLAGAIDSGPSHIASIGWFSA